MQDYIDLAAKNGITLLKNGQCQFCGANTKRGVHECVELFSLGFQQIDFSIADNHLYRFLSVDAHTLQHPEIHGRWNNHFHLTRLQLIFAHQIHWHYSLSPKLSDCLNQYKAEQPDEYLTPPPTALRRGITTTDVRDRSASSKQCQVAIVQWAMAVYQSWDSHHATVDQLAHRFLAKNDALRKLKSGLHGFEGIS